MRAIIWGPDNYNTLGLLRQLSVIKVSVLLLVNGRNNKCATQSRYCKEYKITSDYKEGLDFLLSDKLNYEEKTFLFPAGDLAAETIDKNRYLLQFNYNLMGTSKSGLLCEVDDKNIMGKLANEVGLLIPKSFRFTSETQVDNIPIPCILKPTKCFGIKEFKTKIIRSNRKLIELQKLLNPKNEYILQELIPKTNDILVYGCRMTDGTVEYAGQYIKDRWSDDGGGSHGFLTSSLPQYLNLNATTKLLEKIDYYGLFSLEYGFCNNKAYFYEVNLRNDGTSHLFYQAGANLPVAWIQNYLGEKYTVSTRITHDGWNINELYDIINVLRGRISINQYKKDKIKASIFHYYSSDDLIPWKIARRKVWWDIPLRAFLLRFRPQIINLKSKLKL